MISTKFIAKPVGRFDVGKQMPFVMASSLTRTAKEIEQAQVEEVEGKFTVRNQWTRRGPLAFRTKGATKQNQVAWTGTAFEELEKFERGPAGSFTIKLPRAGNFIAIPTSNVRRTKRDIIRASQRPRALKGKRDILLPMHSGRGMVLFQERGRGRSIKRVALYYLVPRARIRQVDVLKRPAEKVFNKRFPIIFTEQALKAIATAR